MGEGLDTLRVLLAVDRIDDAVAAAVKDGMDVLADRHTAAAVMGRGHGDLLRQRDLAVRAERLPLLGCTRPRTD